MMAVLSLEADTAMLSEEELWPVTRAVMAERWAERVWSGEWVSWLEKERSEGMDQTWTLLSALPESRKLEVASTETAVTPCRCACDVTTSRPVCVYQCIVSTTSHNITYLYMFFTHLPQKYPPLVRSQY